MGRKKKKASKPWCWYCNREFDDEKILIQHQKAKHFKCHICHKKLYTGPGLSIHCMQVHKEAIDKVPNSLSNRSNIEIEIYGMEGIPPEDVKEHEKQRSGGPGGVRDDDSDDDEPAVKKKPPSTGLLPAPPSAPNAPPPTAMPGMYQLPPGMQIMGPMPPPPFMQAPPGMVVGSVRPLFPGAAGAQSTSSASVTPKPAFPAYSTVTISAPPTGVAGSSTSSPARPLVTSTGAASRIMHPPEDVSLEELRARLPRYRRVTRVATPATVSTATSTPTPAPAPTPTVVSQPQPSLQQAIVEQLAQQQHQQQQMAVQLAVAAQKQAQDAHTAALLRSLPRPPPHPQFVPVSLPLGTMGMPMSMMSAVGGRQMPPGPMHVMQQMQQHVPMPQLNMLRPPPMQFPPEAYARRNWH
ncbi:bub3 interacting GLEBS and Zinc finger domain protein isoform X3 [Arctopsyche grandis]|uniref:bub3 interacting GLEBS and Zinc finger domain protein isoform X3 n=1 Tax=Arctopsyche grandis TaxID=121162 RepID=UPI00406D8D7D